LVASIEDVELTSFAFGPPLIGFAERSQRDFDSFSCGDHAFFGAVQVANRGKHIHFNLAFCVVQSGHGPINMVPAPMKTTVEIPDDLFKRAKVLAAQAGLSMKQLITESLQQRVGGRSPETRLEPAWKQAFGAMRAYRKENRRIEKIIEHEFEQIEPEDRK
jgi:hypothetical protein